MCAAVELRRFILRPSLPRSCSCFTRSPNFMIGNLHNINESHKPRTSIYEFSTVDDKTNQCGMSFSCNGKHLLGLDLFTIYATLSACRQVSEVSDRNTSPPSPTTAPECDQHSWRSNFGRGRTCLHSNMLLGFVWSSLAYFFSIDGNKTSATWRSWHEVVVRFGRAIALDYAENGSYEMQRDPKLSAQSTVIVSPLYTQSLICKPKSCCVQYTLSSIAIKGYVYLLCSDNFNYCSVVFLDFFSPQDW